MNHAQHASARVEKEQINGKAHADGVYRPAGMQPERLAGHGSGPAQPATQPSPEIVCRNKVHFSQPSMSMRAATGKSRTAKVQGKMNSSSGASIFTGASMASRSAR